MIMTKMKVMMTVIMKLVILDALLLPRPTLMCQQVKCHVAQFCANLSLQCESCSTFWTSGVWASLWSTVDKLLGCSQFSDQSFLCLHLLSLSLLLVFCCSQQQVNDSHHLASGSRRRRTAATVASHLRSSRRWESCLGKIAKVVSRCLPHGCYIRVSFSWIVLS